MRKNSFRFFSFLIALSLLFSLIVTLPVQAVQEGEKYFVFNALQDEQGGIHSAGSEPLNLSLDAGTSFSATELSLIGGETNAFYISLVNRSNATQIRISYVYEIYGVSSFESVEHILTSQSQAFVLAAPHIDAQNAIRELSISFVGNDKLSGTVELQAFFNISSYVRDGNEDALFSRCHYNDDTGEIEIQGSLSYAATVRYEGETLALFALSEGEDLHLSSKTPIARTVISFNFSFNVAVEGTEALFSRYVVAAVTMKGERIPLCTPTYPSLETAEIPQESGFKGLLSNDLGEMIDVLPDVGVVDVNLDRLFGEQSTGILYAGEYDYYYFDQDYMTQIDAKIKNLVGIGSHVYLRILADGKSTGLSFVDTAPDGVQNRLPVIRSKQAQRDLFAVIDFITARYSAQTAISGLILGHAADLFQAYSYCAADNLAEYSTLYAAMLNLVAGAARRNIPTLRVMIPISDRVFSQSVTALQSTNDYYGALFLPSLLTALESQILSPQPIGVLLESTVLTDLVGGEEKNFLGVDRMNSLISELQSIAKRSPYLSTEIFFSWQLPAGATETQLRADYLLKYAALLQNSAVSTFLLDLSADRERTSYERSLLHLVKYVNTDRYDVFCADALEAIGVQSITQIYPHLTQLRKRTIYNAELTPNSYAYDRNITGKYAFWSFSTATDTLDWYAGNGCQALSLMIVENDKHVLSARCKGQDGYADLSYHFDAPVNLSFAPLLCTELAISGDMGTRYEVQLRLIGEKSVVYAGAIVTAGTQQRLYLDLLQNADALTSLRNVRVMVRPLDTQSEEFEISLSQITLESTILSNEELAQRVHEIRQNTDNEDSTTQTKRDYTIQLVVTGVIVVFSIAVSMMLIIGYRIRRKRAAFIKKDNRKE